MYFTVYARYTRHKPTLLTDAINPLGCSRRLHQTSSVGKHMTASAMYQVYQVVLSFYGWSQRSFDPILMKFFVLNHFVLIFVENNEKIENLHKWGPPLLSSSPKI